MTGSTIDRMPLYVAGLTLVLELGATLPYPLSGAVSAGLATAVVLAVRKQLVVADPVKKAA